MPPAPGSLQPASGQPFGLKLASKASKLLKLPALGLREKSGGFLQYMNTLRRRLKNQAGFNLIELMIVIAIIGLLIGVGAIAWGAMIRAGNETAAAQTLDRIRTYQAQYASRNRGRFATFDQLIQSAGLDDKFTGDRPVVNGYVFTMTLEEPSAARPASYRINADPQVPTGVNATGSRFFYTDSSLGTIKANDSQPAKAEDPSI